MRLSFPKTIGARMILGTVSIFLAIITVLMFSVDYYLRELSKEQLAIITKNEQVKTKNLVHTMSLSLSEVYRKNKETHSLDELKNLIGEHTCKVWYDKTGYFFVYDMQGNTIALPPDTSLHGKNRWDLKDSEGKYLLREFVELVRTKSEGYVDYHYKNPQTNANEKKFAYLEMIPGTEWLIGSGSYYSGVDSVLGESRSRFLEHIIRMRGVMLAGALGSILLAAFLSGLLTRAVSRTLVNAVQRLSDHMAKTRAMSSRASLVSRSMAEAASEQASAIEETGSSLEEMASMTRQNAENASQAQKLMTETERTAEDAATSMNQLTASMHEISVASEETQKIIKTIDEIAFQTNLLALNAAVEAARAGEAGAGFAVVADEVRNLAMRAADAAKNTASLIEETAKKVRAGAELVDKTNRGFQQVAASVVKSGELITEITTASSEQAQGIEQINRAVSEMDRITQENAANAEQSASSSDEMAAQADQMRDIVSALLSIVGGTGRNRLNPLEEEKPRTVIATANLRKAPVTSNKNTKKRKPAELTASKPTAEKIPPERMIPFDDEEFNEF